MITATMLVVTVVVMTLVTALGLFAWGWGGFLMWLLGAATLTLIAATSERFRARLDLFDDKIDDEQLFTAFENRFGVKVADDVKAKVAR